METTTTVMERIPSSKLIIPQLVNKYAALYDVHKISLLNSILNSLLHHSLRSLLVIYALSELKSPNSSQGFPLKISMHFLTLPYNNFKYLRSNFAVFLHTRYEFSVQTSFRFYNDLNVSCRSTRVG